MPKNSFIFTKKLGDILVDIRKTAKLSQKEVAELIGISSRYGHSYISRLEQGKIKNPFLKTIILYLDACNASYNTFFTKLSQIRFSEKHQEVLSQAQLPAIARIRKKLDRDSALYFNKIKHQIKAPKLNMDKLNTKIERELGKFLSDHKTDKDLIPIYQDFASYVKTRVLNQKPNPPLDITPWQKSGIRPILLHSINQMIYKIVHKEQKKLDRRRIPTTEKQKKMVIGFVKYRAMIEQVEAEVHKLLNELQVPFAFYIAYKDFARECFSNLKKLYYKDPPLLSQRLAEIKAKWRRMKLDENVLEKVKEITIKEFQKIFPRLPQQKNNPVNSVKKLYI